MIQSRIIEEKIKELTEERSSLQNKIKPVPRGYLEKELVGFRSQFNGGSFMDSIRNTDFSPSNAKYVNVLKYKGEKISKEVLKQLRQNVIKENEPYIKRVNEIDELLPILNRKLAETKASELLETTLSDKDEKSSSNDKINLSEHGKLKKFVESFIQTEDFVRLNIPKHETLLTNHKKKIENLLKQKYSNYKIKLSSFYTILSRFDYSKSRKK